MVGFKKKCWALVGTVWLLSTMMGCSDGVPVRSDDVLITVGDSRVTVEEFNRNMELAQSAYSQGSLRDPQVMQEIRLGVLNQIIEERMLLNIAESFDLTVSDDDVESEAAIFKADYPKGVFEQLLLESAVSYESWKRSLKIRLLAQKVAETVLGDRIVITSDDISAYLKKHFAHGRSELNGAVGGDKMNERIIARLRSEKIEKAYAGWMAALKRRMKIEVNPQEWKRIIEVSGDSFEK